MSFAPDSVYEDDAAVTNMVFSAQKYAESGLASRREQARTDWLFYNSQHDPKLFGENVSKYPYSQRLFIPYVFSQIEHAMPHLVLSIVENDPIVRALPQKTKSELPHDVIQEARAVEAVQNAQLESDLNIRDKLPLWTRDRGIFGTKFVQLGWSNLKETIRQTVWDPSQGFRLQEMEAQTKNGPTAYGLPIWDSFPDPRSRDAENMRFFIARRIYPIDDLLRLIQGQPGKNWQNADRRSLEMVMGSLRGDDDMVQRMAHEIGKGEDELWSVDGENERLVMTYEMWERDRHIIVAGKAGGRNVLLLNEHNPFNQMGIPVVVMRHIPLDNEIFGKGIAEQIRDLNHEANMVRNLRMVNQLRSVNNLLFVNSYAGLNVADLNSRPWGAYPVRGRPSDAVHQLEHKDVTQNAYQESQLIEQQIQWTTGVTNFVMGTPAPGFNDTVRGLGMMKEAASARFSLSVHGLAGEIGQMCRKIHAMNQQFLTTADCVRVAGKEGYGWVNYDPRQFARKYDFVITARPEVVNKAAWFQSMVNAVNVLAPLGGPQLLNMEEIGQEVFRSLGFRDAQRFLKPILSQPERIENAMFMANGNLPPVQQTDDHEKHYAAHRELVTTGQAAQYGRHGELVVEAHLRDHASIGSGAPQMRQPQLPPPQQGGQAPNGNPFAGLGSPGTPDPAGRPA